MGVCIDRCITIIKVNKLLTLIAGFAPSMFYILLVIIIDKELNPRGACLYLNSKKSNGNKRKNLLGKNERIGLQKKVTETRA